ncbi:ABC transporter ATP-binding protein [Actinospica robiniae]|uniref:ABC transporter ATP-binding protein n=1 Tax=Actinospica robiniae TaxID=304901 RepID=UPI0003FB7AC1|nr:ABC transporter ATP-binding protein [Actinospica robiniae]
MSATLSGPAALADGRDTAGRGSHIRFERLSLGYGRRTVLADVDLEAAPGEILVVVGPSGCGKSTLLRGVAGLLPVGGGRITVDGSPVTGPGPDRAMIFQEDALLPWLDVRRNIEFPLTVKGHSRLERDEQARSWIEQVGLAGFESHLPRQLSGGMRQRVQLARALIGGPPTVLMDEPFGALDPATRAAMRRLLVTVWQESSPTVLFVTHDVDEALALGDRIVVLGRRGVRDLVRVPSPRVEDVAREQAREQILDALEPEKP